MSFDDWVADSYSKWQERVMNVSAMYACAWCGGYGEWVNLRGGVECAGCGAPKRRDVIGAVRAPALIKDLMSNAEAMRQYRRSRGERGLGL